MIGTTRIPLDVALAWGAEAAPATCCSCKSDGDAAGALSVSCREAEARWNGLVDADPRLFRRDGRTCLAGAKLSNSLLEA